MTVHSRIVQRNVSDPMDAPSEFDNIGADGSIPLVVVPRWNHCFYCCLTIPSGVFVLSQRWSARMGYHQPGLIPFWPAWNKISHIVTKASKTYNAPVRNCPTSDNVMVSVDVSITFQVHDAERFVYELGAHRFDEFLTAQTDEAVRGLVHDVPAMRVLDLREEFAMGMLSGLNSKVNPYGISILNVKITNVMLPNQLADTLENTTAYQTQMEQQEKAHAADMRVILDNATRELTKIRKANERKVQDLVAAHHRALIEREEKLVSAKTDMEVAILETKANGNVSKTEANSEKQNAVSVGERKRVETVEKARAAANMDIIRANQQLENTKIAAEAKLKEMEAIAEALLIEAKVEEEAATQLKEVRNYEVEKRRHAVMQQLAGSSNMVFSGDTGDKILKALVAPAQSRMSR